MAGQCKECGSYAINPHCHGREPGVDLDLCDVCYWRARASAPRAEAVEALTLARAFHDTYERLAPSFGYTTRPETRQFDPASPNGKLMIAVCEELAAIAQGADEGERNV